MTIEYTKILDQASWGREHWKFFIVVSLNYILDGVMFSIAPLLAYLIAPTKAPLIFALNLLSETAGAIVLGRLADIYGRRAMFSLSLMLEVIALLLLVPLHSNFIAFTILTSLMTFGVGGEFGAAYSAIAELTPVKHRGKALMLSTNFWNVGAAMIAGLSLIYTAISEDIALQIQYLLLSALGTAVVAGLVRLAFPESPRWLISKGRVEEAKNLIKKITGYRGIIVLSEKGIDDRLRYRISLGTALSKYRFRFSILAIITVSQYVTYNIAAYYLPYAPGFAFTLSIVPLLIFIANLGASTGAFMLLPLIDRARRLSVLLSFLGGAATAILLLISHEAVNLVAFCFTLLINLIFSEWAWASLSVLQSELFPTNVRASIVGLLTGLTGMSGALIVYSSSFLAAKHYLSIVIGLWITGLIAAATWYFKGIESAQRTLEELV